MRNRWVTLSHSSEFCHKASTCRLVTATHIDRLSGWKNEIRLTV